MNIPFEKITYNVIRPRLTSFTISKFVGIDSETLTSGAPFLICTDGGRELRPKHFWEDIFCMDGKRIDFGTWNLRFDSGSFLYYLPYEVKRELWENNRVKYQGVWFDYIPHKMLRMRRGNEYRNFWDIMPFYTSGLDAAARKYLGESKFVMETKDFTLGYVKQNFRKIKRYCVRDAQLTARLGDYLLRYLNKFDIYPNSFYSTASISLTHFRNQGAFVPVDRFWKKNQSMLKFAHNSYYGGKFEVTARGRFTGYEYDITSAYGSEIAKLKDISTASVTRRANYVDDSDYGFLHVLIKIKRECSHSIPFQPENLSTYPIGHFRAWITKNELLHLRQIKAEVKILDAWWLKCHSTYRPFAKEINRLFKIKERYEHRDPMISKLSKLMINSLYGKFCQVTEKPDGSFKAGAAWNPIYGAVITANIRLRMSNIQRYLGDQCLAVHTDSFISSCPMPKKFCSNKIGGWEQKANGSGVIVACGMYQIGDKLAHRSFLFRDGQDWFKTLDTLGGNSVMEIVERRPSSWTQQISRGLNKDINKFVMSLKRLNVNCELKRIWPEKTNGRKLLAKLQHSLPMIAVDC